jgi:hypothetical protein
LYHAVDSFVCAVPLDPESYLTKRLASQAGSLVTAEPNGGAQAGSGSVGGDCTSCKWFHKLRVFPRQLQGQRAKSENAGGTSRVKSEPSCGREPQGSPVLPPHGPGRARSHVDPCSSVSPQAIFVVSREIHPDRHKRHCTSFLFLK